MLAMSEKKIAVNRGEKEEENWLSGSYITGQKKGFAPGRNVGPVVPTIVHRPTPSFDISLKFFIFSS